MPITTIQRATQEGIAAALRALLDGQLVMLPTETVTGVAALACRSDTMDRLFADRAANAVIRPALAWHAPDSAVVFDLLAAARAGQVSGVHRRLIERLTPGPVQFAIEFDEGELVATRAWLGVPSGVCDEAGRLIVRVSSHPVAMAVLGGAWAAGSWADGRSEAAVVLRSAWSLGADERSASVPDTVEPAQSRVPISMAIDASPLPTVVGARRSSSSNATEATGWLVKASTRSDISTGS